LIYALVNESGVKCRVEGSNVWLGLMVTVLLTGPLMAMLESMTGCMAVTSMTNEIKKLFYDNQNE
jgi:hypothetical protein